MSARKANKRRKAGKRKESIDLARVAAGADEADEAAKALSGEMGEDETVSTAEAPAPEETAAPAESDAASPSPAAATETGDSPEGDSIPEGEPAEVDTVETAPVTEDGGGEAGVAEAGDGDKEKAGTAAEAAEAEEVVEPTKEAPADPTVVGELQVRSAVEAVIFAADDPVTPAQVAKATGVKPASVRKSIKDIQARLDATGSGIALEEIAGGLQFMTREEHAPAIRKLRKSAGTRKLTAPALESLAIVAYKQPVQRQELEDIRGVSCGPILRTLMEHGLVKIVGRAEVLGRPLLYGTTKRFLDTFGLASVKDLPKVGELMPK